jgi:hypothetical protein
MRANIESKGYSWTENRKKVRYRVSNGCPGALYFEATPLIAFGTPNNSVKASLIEAGIPLNVCRDVRVKKL